MQRIVTGKVSKQVDGYCISQIGIPSLVLMERAALSVVNEIIRIGNDRKRILIVCGTGNNGADGLAIARILNEKLYQSDIVIIGNTDKASDEFMTQLKINNKLGIKYENISESEENILNVIQSYDIIVDAIFGIGLSREIKGIYKNVIECINKNKGYKIAVDIPSGLCSNSGKVLGVAIKANKTVTFGTLKTGLLLCEARDYSGKLVVAKIGFPEFVYDQISQDNHDPLISAYEQKDIAMIPQRSQVSNKGDFGKVLVIAGSENMCGAAYFSAKAAYRTGAGIVEILTHTNNLSTIKASLPEAIIKDYNTISKEEFDKELQHKSVIVIGPGLSVSERTKQLLKATLKANCPIIIDADGLNTISQFRTLLPMIRENIIVTPHIKEMSRLIQKDSQYIKENILDCAYEFSTKYNCVTVLKDCSTVIANPKGNLFINTSGNSGMATGGSGDVLTGVIAGLISCKLPIYEAAPLGVYLHGLAGNEAASNISEYSMMASDLIDALSKIIMSR